MENIMEYNQWVTNTTGGEDEQNVEYNYTSKDKIYYGEHDIFLSFGDKRTKVHAKFDTGARTSSIDISVAQRLGIVEDLIKATGELDLIKVPKDISKNDKLKLEKSLTEEYTTKYPGISSVQLSKSASGFSLRPYVRLIIEFNNRYVTTEANIKDRKGMSCEMLVGLGDML